MHFQLYSGETPHSKPATCVTWASSEEIYSAGDDNQIQSWVFGSQESKLAQLGQDVFPTDLQFLPKSSGKYGDLLLLSSADGRFYILNKTGRIERSVEAHKGAILAGQWSSDGTGLLTAGEDGQVKIWSRSGMLRSTVVSSDNSVYGACWSPDNQSIAYTQGKCLVIKQLAPNTKPVKWKAHDGLVLCLAWSDASDTIVSGGEDCRYRVWDTQGRQLFASSHHDNHITSVAWAPSGEQFAVGSYNCLRLCDYSGWSWSLDATETGSIYKLAWSPDGTHVACASANGRIFSAGVVKRVVYFGSYKLSTSDWKDLLLDHVIEDYNLENLDIPDRVIHIALRYDHAVATTPTQCYIYDIYHPNTPTIINFKEGSVSIVMLCEKHVLLVERGIVGIYNFQGKLIASPRWPNMRPESLRWSHLSLSPDTFAVRDSNDLKIVHLIDLTSTKSTIESPTIQHSTPIIQIALNQLGDPSSRMLAILDKAKDLYIVHVRDSNRAISKLARKIDSFTWNATDNSLAAIQDAQLIVWCCPTATFNAKLRKLCSYQHDSSELGRNPRVKDFVGNLVAVRRADGPLINVPVSPYPGLIYKHISDNKWSEALNLCRSANNEMAWACLAALATQASCDTIDIAEEAYANINHHEKVFYLQYVKTLPTKTEKKAHMVLLAGRRQEAESILLHNGMVFQAIYMNVNIHNWTRALDLALQHKTHIDTVLYLRQKYLEKLGKPENNNKFNTLKEGVQIDVEKVEQKLGIELQKRKSSH